MSTTLKRVQAQSNAWAEFLELYDEHTRNAIINHGTDRALFHLLTANRQKLGDFPKTSTERYYFHKMFRQTDVTGNGNTDMAIWVLIADSPTIMGCMAKYIRDKRAAKRAHKKDSAPKKISVRKQ